MFSSRVIPNMPLLGLSEDEQQLIKTLQSKALLDRSDMELSEAYYLGCQVVQNLRIAVPPEVEQAIRTIVGWGALAVDPYVERHAIDCFRLPDGTDADDYLTSIANANGLDAELPVAFTDVLSMGRTYWMVGSSPDGGAPRITAESPLNTSVLWDLSGRVARAAISEYRDEQNTLRGVLMVPHQTILLAQNDKGEWEISGRDMHDFGFVPIIRQANRVRTSNRAGRSAITEALRSAIDSTCRTLLGLEVAREIYSAPRMILAGASEKDFVGSDGKPRKAWDTYISRVLGLERDEDGNVPELKQLTVYDPSTFTKLVDNAAARAASEVLAPPQDIGLYTDGNPISAEALNTSESRRNRRARSQQREAGVPLGEVMKLAVRFDNKGVLPDKYRSIAVDWFDVEEPNIVGISDAITKQITAEAIPATSDVTLKKLGWSAVERKRLEQDRKSERGANVLKMIANNGQPPAAEAPANGNPTGL